VPNIQDEYTKDVERERRDITCRAMTLAPSSIDEETRTAEAVLATDEPVLVYDFREMSLVDEVLRVDGVDLPKQVPLLDSHTARNLDSIRGSWRGLRVEDGRVLGRMHFVEGDDFAERAWQKVRQGHVTDVSAGYRVLDYETIPARKSATVKGVRYQAGDRPLRITTQWQLREGSLVPFGADPGAKIRTESNKGETSEVGQMNEHQRAYLVSIGLDAGANEEAARAYVEDLEEAQRAEYDRLGQERAESTEASSTEHNGVRSETPSGSTEAATDPSVAAERALLNERKRVREIKKLASERTPTDVVERAIDEGYTVEQAARAFLDAERSTFAGPVSGGRSVTPEPTTDLLGMGLRLAIGAHEPSANMTDAERQEHDKRRNQADKLRLNDMSLVDMCRHSLIAAGREVPLGRDNMIRAAVSSGDIADVFTQSVDAVLMNAWEEYPDTTNGWVREVDVGSFLTQDRHGMDPISTLPKLPRGGTAKHAAPSETKESYSIARYAQQFVIDEQDIIDDNLNALQEMPMAMGAAARRLRPDLVYYLMLSNPTMDEDSNSLFDATNHGNKGTVTLSETNLKEAVEDMRIQQSASSVNLNIEPRFLIVGANHEFLARTLINSAEIRNTTSSTIYGTRNVLTDLGLQLRVDSRIDNGVTDPASGTTDSGDNDMWFLAASPATGRTVEVGYLRGTGRRRPAGTVVGTAVANGRGFDPETFEPSEGIAKREARNALLNTQILSLGATTEDD